MGGGGGGNIWRLKLKSVTDKNSMHISIFQPGTFTSLSILLFKIYCFFLLFSFAFLRFCFCFVVVVVAFLRVLFVCFRFFLVLLLFCFLLVPVSVLVLSFTLSVYSDTIPGRYVTFAAPDTIH